MQTRDTCLMIPVGGDPNDSCRLRSLDSEMPYRVEKMSLRRYERTGQRYISPPFILPSNNSLQRMFTAPTAQFLIKGGEISFTFVERKKLQVHLQPQPQISRQLSATWTTSSVTQAKLLLFYWKYLTMSGNWENSACLEHRHCPALQIKKGNK